MRSGGLKRSFVDDEELEGLVVRSARAIGASSGSVDRIALFFAEGPYTTLRAGDGYYRSDSLVLFVSGMWDDGRNGCWSDEFETWLNRLEECGERIGSIEGCKVIGVSWPRRTFKGTEHGGKPGGPKSVVISFEGGTSLVVGSPLPNNDEIAGTIAYRVEEGAKPDLVVG